MTKAEASLAAVLVTGGNGSGKTTLMKMLLGLYPTAGRIRWDGATVHGARLGTYRGLFSAIFGGQLLFDRLYGVDADRERVEALLDRFFDRADHLILLSEGRVVVDRQQGAATEG